MTKAFPVGFPGLMKRSFTPAACAQGSRASLANPEPLSITLRLGRPRCAASRSSTDYARPAQQGIDLDGRALAAIVVDDVERVEDAPVAATICFNRRFLQRPG